MDILLLGEVPFPPPPFVLPVPDNEDPEAVFVFPSCHKEICRKCNGVCLRLADAEDDVGCEFVDAVPPFPELCRV